MTEVNAIINATVNVSKEELYIGLCKELGVYKYIFEVPDDGYYKVDNDTIYLIENISRHGSPNYQPTWYLQDKRLSDIYRTMVDLKKFIYD